MWHLNNLADSKKTPEILERTWTIQCDIDIVPRHPRKTPETPEKQYDATYLWCFNNLVDSRQTLETLGNPGQYSVT
jgi:hypothetical protein